MTRIVLQGDGGGSGPNLAGGAVAGRFVAGNAQDDWFDVTCTTSQRTTGGDTTTTDGDAIVRTSTSGTVKTDYTFAITRFGNVGTITFTSSNPAVATIDQAGRLTHVADGTTTITISDSLGVRSLSFPLTLTSGTTVLPLIQGGAAGSVRKNATDAVNNRIAGLSPAAAKPLFSTQDHAAGTYVWNTGSWLAGVDLTCVSPWNDHAVNLQPVTLIAPDVVAMATHYHFAEPAGGRFVMADGTVVPWTVTSLAALTGFSGVYPDITLGKLSAAVPAGITPAKVLPTDWKTRLPHVSAYFPAGYGVLLPIAVIDQDQHANVHDASLGIEYADGGTSGSYVTGGQSQDPTRASFFEAVVTGDSGHPIFAIINGVAVLLGLTTNATPWATAITSRYAAINSVMTALGSAYQLTPIDLSGFNSY